jgi:hypothetical protein
MARLAVFKTDLCADVVESCPVEPDVVICGTYQLNEETSKREGLLYLLTADAPLLCSGDPEGLECVQRIETPGVFDAKW